MHPKEIALPEAKSSGARFSRHIRHTGVVLVRGTPDPPEPELSISPPSMSNARLPLRSAMTGTVAGAKDGDRGDDWRGLLVVPGAIFVLLLVLEDGRVSSSAAGEERQNGREKNVNAFCPKDCCSSLLADA